MLYLLHMGPFKVLTTLLQVQCSKQLTLLELFSLLRFCSSWGPQLFNTDLFFCTSRNLFLHCLIWPCSPSFCQCSAPTPPLPTNILPSSWLLFYTSCLLFSPASPRFTWVLQWNAVALRARSAELLHFISLHSVDRIRFSGLRSNSTHSPSGIFTPVAVPSFRVIVLSSLGRIYPSLNSLPFFSFSSLDPCSDYVGVNISLNSSSSLSFFNVCAPPICSFLTDSRTVSPPTGNFFILGEFSCHLLPSGLKRYFRPPWGAIIRLGHLF